MKLALLTGLCALVAALCVAATPVASAAKCTKKSAAAGSCSLVVAHYVDDLTAFSVTVSLKGKVRTASIVIADTVTCLGGAELGGSPADGTLRGKAVINAKGRFSGTFAGQTDNNVPLTGPMHGTISTKTATLTATVTGARNDPEEPPPLTCKGTIKASARRS
jgi:hypothetical protein